MFRAIIVAAVSTTAQAVGDRESIPALAAASLEARRAVLQSLIAQLVVDSDTARVVYRLPFPGREMLPSPLGALLIDLPIIWRQPKAPSQPHS